MKSWRLKLLGPIGNATILTPSWASFTTKQKKKLSFTAAKLKPKLTAKTFAKSYLYLSKSKKILFTLLFWNSDGLMYNPINMVVEDEQRLIEKDIRDKNKKKRYEVRQ